MGLGDLFKLEKLKIRAYKTTGRKEGDLLGTFEAMFNPESYQRSYAIAYAKGEVIGTSDPPIVFNRNEPSELSIKLLLDGTGVDELGIEALAGRKTVTERVEKFLKLTYQIWGTTHQPSFLKVEWGDLKFSCVLKKVNISYTSFDRDGTALRAELDTTFVSEMDAVKASAKTGLSSPDLTHHRVVHEGDTLLLLTKDIYGTPDPYLVVAAVNGLDDFRNLKPGVELIFPPLVLPPPLPASS